MTNTPRKNWRNDIRAAVSAIGYDQDGHDAAGGSFNDKHLTCRRIKFYLRQDVTDKDLQTMQEIIQARNPELLVTVSRWNGTSGHYGSNIFGNVVVYYRPKVGRIMHPERIATRKARQEWCNLVRTF
jgi:hypothetical protein